MSDNERFPWWRIRLPPSVAFAGGMARFTLFGISVAVDPWFLIGLFFIFSWSGGGRIGVIAAIALGILTLVHELGHALVAKRFGCQSSISLNLFVGWASYSPTRELSRRQQIVISAAGPIAQLVIASAVLSGVFIVARRTLGATPGLLAHHLWLGISWAGVTIALLNLLPLWPLDGGHIVEGILSKWMPRARSLRITLIGTLVGIGALVVVGVWASRASAGWFVAEQARPREALLEFRRGSLPGALWSQARSVTAHVLDLPWFLLAFSGLTTVQTLSRLSQRDAGATLRAGTSADGALTGEVGATGRPDRQPARQPSGLPERRAVTNSAEAAAAEDLAWLTGEEPTMPRGWGASPWLLAHLADRRNDPGGVVAALGRVVTPGRAWSAPEPSEPALGGLLARVIAPWPVGDPAHSATLLRIATYHASPHAFLEYASRLYGALRRAEVLYLAAGGLSRRGHRDDAIEWLRRATADQPSVDRIVDDPDFAPLAGYPPFEEFLAELRRRSLPTL